MILPKKVPAHPPHRSMSAKIPRAGEGPGPDDTSSGDRRARGTNDHEVHHRLQFVRWSRAGDAARAGVSVILLAIAAILFGWAYDTSLTGSFPDLSIDGALDGYRKLFGRTP